MGIPYAEVIGDPISHSKSPMIHNFWLAKLGMEADFTATRIDPAGLEAYFADRRGDSDWLGCSVTIPHKQSVMALMDEIEERAAKMGAVNIVSRGAPSALVGDNSDADGFLEPLRPLLATPHLFRMARILGAGGAARAVAHALAAQGFTLVVAARDTAKARALLQELRGEHHPVSLSHFAEPTNFEFDNRRGLLDLIVNTTPLGMEGQPRLELDWSHVPPGSIVYDLVYAPLETPLLAEARERGHRIIDGLHMLVGQAAIAFERFFGRPAPRRYDAELRTLLTS